MQGFRYRMQFVLREAEVLPKAPRSLRAVQFEHSLVSAADDMDVCRPMVIRINRDTKIWEP